MVRPNFKLKQLRITNVLMKYVFSTRFEKRQPSITTCIKNRALYLSVPGGVPKLEFKLQLSRELTTQFFITGMP